MQNNFLTSIRSMRLIDGCKGAQVCTVNPSSTVAIAAEKFASLRPTFSLRSKSISQQQQHPPKNQNQQHHHHTPSLDSLLSTFGLPSPDLIEPSIDAFLRPIKYVDSLATSFRSLSSAISSSFPSASLCDIYLERFSLFQGIGDPKLLRRALRLARVYSSDIHHKVVLSAWLRFERREDELEPFISPAACSQTSPSLECPHAALSLACSSDGMPSSPCPCRCTSDPSASSSAPVLPPDLLEIDIDLWFCIGEEEIPCIRSNIAALSRPLSTLLYGGFSETRRDHINFTHNGISARAMRAVEAFSRGGSIDDYPRDTVLEALAFANRFCCEGLKAACDAKLASIVRNVNDALFFIDYGLEEAAYLLVAACLQIFLRGLPGSLQKSEINLIFCTPEGREQLAMAGHASFALYYFLSHVAMEEDMRSNITVMLSERMTECAASGWQKQLSMHQLGCVMLERGECKDAQKCFEAAVQEGHTYSLVGLARAKYNKGHKYSAYKLLNSMISDYPSYGWMYQERSLYCNGKEKMADLNTATELDPTLSYPYKCRAALLAEDKPGAAVAEINKILGFKVSTDCLELRAWLYLALGKYDLALQDIRAILTLNPDYLMFNGQMHAEQLIDTLRQYVQPWDMADCWMQLYDRWSAVDDIGSLAVVHQMLTKEPGNSGLRFRQSLLLLRLNLHKAAMHSLRMARNHSTSEHERLIYEGWILYDTGHRKEGLAKAEQSIALQRSFEAFFLKAYALADTSLDHASSSQVIQLLEQANSCASDNLRKGQARNNMGSIYVDCDMLAEAAECYVKALGIKHTRAHQGLARVYYLKNQKKAAYDEMTKLIEKAKSNASAYEKRSEYCDRDMARSDLNMATNLDPLRTYPYRYRAAVLMDDHKEEEAIAELSRAISFKPELQLLHLRAAFHDSMGNADATFRDCEAALCVEPDHADTVELYNRARARAAERRLSFENDVSMNMGA